MFRSLMRIHEWDGAVFCMAIAHMRKRYNSQYIK